MKAYKATYNGKCKDIKYQIGKTYTLKGELKMCARGFHYCKNFEDLIQYYNFVEGNKYNEDIKVFEIENLGKNIKKDNKSVSDKIKILRELNKKEIIEKIKGIYKFDENNNVILAKFRNGNIYKWKYDKNNNMIWKKDYMGDISKYKYDDQNNMIWKKDYMGDIYQWEYKYDDNNNKIWEKDFYGDIYEYKYDDNNNIIWKKDPNGDIGKWKYKYDKNNNVILEKYPNRDMFEYKYDEKNNMIWKKDSLGDIFEWEYTNKRIIKKENNKILEEITIS